MSRTELVEEFLRSAAGTTATVETVPSNAGSLNDALCRATGDAPVILALAGDVDQELFSKFRKNERVITEPAREQMRSAGVAVTDAFCGVASTGSVCVAINRGLSGPASSLAREHIAVVESKAIVRHPRDVFSGGPRDGGIQRSFSFITGPSATADMGPLVRGVHGPGKLHIIVLE